jgi:hypothetical protein
LRVLGGAGAVVLLALPQVVMPRAWVADSGLAGHQLWRVAASALVSLLLVPVLRLVSYRRRDWLVLAFVPVLQYVLAWRIGYRAALLPLRDWTPRPDERLRARRLRRGALWVLLPEVDYSGRDVGEADGAAPAPAETAAADPVTGVEATTRQVTWRSPLAQPSLRG